jgi:tetratricopeptide (TPR) repeat protein
LGYILSALVTGMSETLAPKQLSEEAKIAYQRADFALAGRVYQAAAQGYLEAGEPLMVAEMNNNASVAYLQAGEAESALQVVEGTDGVFASAGDTRRQGMALGNRGTALEALGRLSQAADAYRQSADLLKQVGETELHGRVMQSLSALQLRTGHQLEALATMNAGLEGISKPNLRQRLLKRLLQMPYKLLGKP